ncbi:LegC family aminotransferase [uncultured Treponema sp.]|uniref:LegC family aminotransferase n=1 Tax=uncultured Treponema sp. TaxID=162155 RepID=UPI0025E62384|nr:LegC family aminotransferase [uncultured Treponema sp.]
MKYAEEINFIKKLYKNEEHVMLHAPIFMGNEKKYLDDCIDTTFVSSVGQYVDRFEKDIETYTGATRAVVCVNGTMALFMALKLCEVKPEDEVITQPLTFIATANAIAYCNAQPVFCDIDEETMGLAPNSVRKWLEKNAELRADGCFDKKNGRRISAVVPMHTFGNPVKVDEFVKLCEEWKLALVEDAAESIGSFYKGRHTGTFGKVGCMSFNGNKTITCGGGGMLLFMDAELGEKAKHLTTQAKIPHRWEFRHDAIGYNLRMPNINAALGCAQLECIDKILANKRETAMAYREYFSNSKEIKYFDEPKDCKSNFWFNSILLPNKKAQQEFLEETNDNGVQTRPIWELMNRLPMYKNCQRDDLKNAIMFADRVVNIPSGYRK